MQPQKLCGERGVGAAEVDTSESREAVKEVVKGRVKHRIITGCGGPEERKVVEELGEGIRNKAGGGKDNLAERSSGEGGWLDDQRRKREHSGMFGKGNRDSAKLGGD